ncbi:uncharacterized protein L3040_006238 [Drepanopeziza brunnea f. sp. 'multigermtubi']|uniref:Allantoate permease n=1 Tax=Marssonina brunnea f. sp. multigermtubi (strain MB_m1) TaxID=1072389 RepID=K1WWP5_MARBU|nr:allantoate permease [Drepanopeziza brunnea f. sp. 'multigermtubi' MB_m1]EKD16952.1 allantoate permease [Drepanopeziza brunnea f. sp. 'multigermtubi' MB_m1]KAJ5040586.1 hypothetical protein L3040_006238 [Drepanopeziza brunnea f. sp. 'multigermtubi']
MAAEITNSGSPEVHKDTPKKDTDVGIAHVERREYGGKDATDFNQVDKEVAKYTSDVRIDIDEATNSRLKKLINRRVLVIMIITYFLQALDKGTISFASIMGIQKDTGLVGQQYSWLTTCIYIAVLTVEYPTNWIIQRVPIAKYLSINIILWGTVLMLHAVAKNFTTLVTLRTLLGIFEACCQPIFIVMSSMWFKREEQAATVSYWYMMNGAQQVVGGLLAYCFTLLKSGPLKSWQALFISYGAVAILWGFFVLFYLPDSPMRAKCFSEHDKVLLVERVRGNQTGMQNRVFKREQMLEAFRDPQTWCYCGIAVTTTLPTSGLGAFANIIITGFDFTILETQLLAMVLGFYIIFVLLGSAWLVRKTGQNLLVMLGFVVPSFVGTIVLMTVENTGRAQQVGLLISYYITLSFWSAQTLALSMISRNIAGQTKKSTVVATNFVAWATGNAIGPQVFLKWNAPRYLIAFTVHLVCYSLLVVVILGLRWHLSRENSRKDALAEAGIQEARDQEFVHAFEDLTDRANPNFRYVF